MTTVYIVSFYAYIIKIGTRFYHCRLPQSKADKKAMLLCKKLFQLGVANGYLYRVLNTIITDKIVTIRNT